VLAAGVSQTLSATFTPTDTANYATSTASVTISVAKATPVIMWPTPAGIIYGTPLSGTQLNATANTPATFVYTPAAGTVLSAGASQTLSVTVTPSDTANFTTSTKTVTFDVAKATPTLAWPTPTAIAAGTPLGATQLNATANVPGTFVYTPGAGTMLGAGAGQTLAAAFTPGDATNYNSVGKSVTIDVVHMNQAPALVNPGPRTMTDTTTYAAAVARDGATSYWRLGETGGTSAADSVGTNPATLIGGVTPAAGALSDGNGALLFNGSTGYVRVVDSAALRQTGDLTIELWVNTPLTTRQTLITKGYRTEFELTLEVSGRLNLYHGDGTTYQNVLSASAAPLVANTWQHVVVTRVAATRTISFYVNGVARGSGVYSVTPAPSSNSVFIGRTASGTQSVAGRLDDVAMYPVALSAAQAAAHYTLGAVGDAPTVVALPLVASDADGDRLTYSATGLPPGLTIDAATGLIAGTLTRASVGTYTVTATVSDGSATAAQTFPWTVTRGSTATPP
jgi:hypothetical protein